ncbi:MAG TPA: lysylphosphatidylglycerol synthase transmembrane domain-containing protein, partial [Terriglobia bacterium]|nr:lysylphosphatidylglycerol synthase transmembrane domain-containing protein [Terriglobia bacterium]
SLVSFAVALFFLYLAFRGANFSDLWESLKGANYWWVSLTIPIALLSHWVRAVRWGYLLAPVKKKTSHRNLFSGVMIGYMVNNALPRVGELVRPYVLGQLEGISKTSALGTVVIERILDFLTFYFTLSLVLFAYPSSLSPFFDNVDSVRPLLLISSVACFFVFVLLFFKAKEFFLLLSRMKVFLPGRFRGRFDRLIESFQSGLAVSQLRSSMLVIVAFSLVIQALYALGLYVPFFAFDSMVALHLNFGAAVILLTISSIAFVLPAPGAMGTYQAFMTFTLVRLYGLDHATALGYSIITHEVGYILVTVVGLYFFLKDRVHIADVNRVSPDDASEAGRKNSIEVS